MEMHASRPLYYFLVTIITQFILAAGAMIILLPTGLLELLPLQTMGALMAYNVAIATLVAAIISGQQGQNERSIQRGAGLVLGHLVGLVLGGFLGSHYGGPAWAIGGAVICYFLVGWIGSQISLAVGTELERLATASAEPTPRAEVRTAKGNTSLLFFFGAVVPLFFMTAAIFVKTSSVPAARFQDLLPAARIVLIVLSLCSIAIPWLRRTEWLKHGNTVTNEPVAPIIGLGLSLAPVIYGFLVFVAFGMSMAEFSVFAVVASVAATTWGVNAARRS
jgi:MFS family permease